MKYRRGIEGQTWQELWHFNEQCKDYPARSFLIADYPPLPEDVCPKCTSLVRDNRGSR